jgi:hypothetical protein
VVPLNQPSKWGSKSNSTKISLLAIGSWESFKNGPFGHTTYSLQPCKVNGKETTEIELASEPFLMCPVWSEQCSYNSLDLSITFILYFTQEMGEMNFLYSFWKMNFFCIFWGKVSPRQVRHLVVIKSICY